MQSSRSDAAVSGWTMYSVLAVTSLKQLITCVYITYSLRMQSWGFNIIRKMPFQYMCFKWIKWI